MSSIFFIEIMKINAQIIRTLITKIIFILYKDPNIVLIGNKNNKKNNLNKKFLVRIGYLNIMTEVLKNSYIMIKIKFKNEKAKIQGKNDKGLRMPMT